MIAKSINQHFPDGKVIIVGHTDSRASDSYNKELGMDRAKSVEDWFKQHGMIKDVTMQTRSMGENNPEATNETAAGRQENRRVEIVAMKS